MVCGALRLYYVVMLDFADVTGSQLPVIITTNAEAGVAIMVSSSPLIKPAFDAISRRVFALMGWKDPEDQSSGATPDQAGTLVTYGGGYMGSSSPSRLKWAIENRGIFSRMQDQAEVDVGGDVEMGGFCELEYPHKVAFASSRILEGGQNTSDCISAGFHRLDEGGLLMSKTIVKMNQKN